MNAENLEALSKLDYGHDAYFRCCKNVVTLIKVAKPVSRLCFNNLTTQKSLSNLAFKLEAFSYTVFLLTLEWTHIKVVLAPNLEISFEIIIMFRMSKFRILFDYHIVLIRFYHISIVEEHNFCPIKFEILCSFYCNDFVKEFFPQIEFYGH